MLYICNTVQQTKYAIKQRKILLISASLGFHFFIMNAFSMAKGLF